MSGKKWPRGRAVKPRPGTSSCPDVWWRPRPQPNSSILFGKPVGAALAGGCPRFFGARPQRKSLPHSPKGDSSALRSHGKSTVTEPEGPVSPGPAGKGKVRFLVIFPCVLQIISVSITTFAGVAQLVEQLTCNQQVAGSSPIASSSGGVPEWPKGTDCKSVGVRLRRFKSSPLHHSSMTVLL